MASRRATTLRSSKPTKGLANSRASGKTAQKSTSVSYRSNDSRRLTPAEGSHVSGHIDPNEPVRFLRAENVAETAKRLMETERKILSVRSETLSLFHGLDGDKFVTFRAKEKKLQCFYSDSKALVFARPIVRWEKPSQHLSFTGLYFGHLRYDDMGRLNGSVLENLQSGTWYDGTIISASELGPEGNGPFFCVSEHQAYGTYAVGRDSKGMAAGLLVWTGLDITGSRESYPELTDKFCSGPVHLDPKDQVDPWENLR